MFTKLNEWTEKDPSKIAPYVQYIYDQSNYRDAFKVLADRKVVGKAVIQFVKDDVPSSKL